LHTLIRAVAGNRADLEKRRDGVTATKMQKSGLDYGQIRKAYHAALFWGGMVEWTFDGGYGKITLFVVRLFGG